MHNCAKITPGERRSIRSFRSCPSLIRDRSMNIGRHRLLRAKERQTHMPCQLPRIATDVGNVWWACFDKNDQQGMQKHIPLCKKMTWASNINQCNLEHKLLWIVLLIYYETLVKVWHFSICADFSGANLSIYWNDWYDIIVRQTVLEQASYSAVVWRQNDTLN